MKISEISPPSEHLRPTSGTPFERRFDGTSMVVRFSLLTAYRTWWYWAVYICPFSVIVVNRYLDLPERPELPERPPKYRKDQRIIGKY